MMVNPDSLVRLLDLERRLTEQGTEHKMRTRLASTTWSLATLAALAAALGAGHKWW